MSTDECYILFFDGAIVGRDSERGDAADWFFETREFDFPGDEHTFVAQVWALGQVASVAQFSALRSFILTAHDNEDLRRATIYCSTFSRHFEYSNALENRGFVTTFESPKPSRSACHARGAHPLFYWTSFINLICDVSKAGLTLERGR